MPSREKRELRRERSSGVLPILIIILLLVAGLLVFMLINSDPLGEKDQEKALVASYPENPSFVEQKAVTPQPLVISEGEKADVTSTPVPEVTPTPAPEVTEAPVQETANRLVPTPMPGDYYLPVCDRALRTPSDEMMIAITVDDCSKAEVMNQIVSIAGNYDVKLTLFPTGEALMNESLQKGFNTCVNRYGFQLGNHTYNHKADYTLSNGEQTKALLAALFLNDNRFLLIDEPTNHLDVKARQKVAEYLKKKKGFILVSHDRRFLDDCVDHILSINRSNIEVQSGNFSSWMMNFERQQKSE